MPIKKFKDGTQVELKDTKKLQLLSLKEFAHVLGYRFDNVHGNFYKIRGDIYPTSRSEVSLYTIQQWHNKGLSILLAGTSKYPWHGEDVNRDIANTLGMKGITPILTAPYAKLVTKTKLQWSKKCREVIVTDHQIELI